MQEWKKPGVGGTPGKSPCGQKEVQALSSIMPLQSHSLVGSTEGGTWRSQDRGTSHMPTPPQAGQSLRSATEDVPGPILIQPLCAQTNPRTDASLCLELHLRDVGRSPSCGCFGSLMLGF